MSTPQRPPLPLLQPFSGPLGSQISWIPRTHIRTGYEVIGDGALTAALIRAVLATNDGFRAATQEDDDRIEELLEDQNLADWARTYGLAEPIDESASAVTPTSASIPAPPAPDTTTGTKTSVTGVATTTSIDDPPTDLEKAAYMDARLFFAYIGVLRVQQGSAAVDEFIAALLRSITVGPTANPPEPEPILKRKRATDALNEYSTSKRRKVTVSEASNSGPPTNPTWTLKLTVDGQSAEASGPSKRAAKEAAARTICDTLGLRFQL